MLSKSRMENLKDLEQMAAAGDAAAQYRLAAHFDQSGRPDDARHWMEKAAAAGHPGALYTKAAAILVAPPDEMEIDQAVSYLKAACDGGGAAALRQFAVLTALGLGVKRDWAGAVTLLTDAARKGHPLAMRELAVLAAMGAKNNDSGAALLKMAAERNEWIAIYLGLRRGNVFSPAAAKQFETGLRGAGAPLMNRLTETQGTSAAGVSPALSSASAPIDFDRLADAARKVSPRDNSAERQSLNSAPDVVHLRCALTREECDYLICASAPLLTPSKVVDSDAGAADHAQYRTSDGAMFGLLDLDLVLIALYERLSHFAGVPFENCELMGILRYRPGQAYAPHHDYLPEDAADYSEVKRSGQRIRTLLVVLNDDFDGGETHFPKLDLKLRGAPGDVFVFHNTDENNAPYPDSLHAGLPVHTGEKWLLTLWCRARPFWFWV